MEHEVLLTCRAEFCAAHHYEVAGWSKEENERTFGKEANPHGHGHNYVVEVTLSGTVNPKSGMVINIKDLKAIVHDVLEELDHKNLNHEIPYFQSRVPTTENLVVYLWGKIAEKLSIGKLDRIRVYEDESLSYEYRG